MRPNEPFGSHVFVLVAPHENGRSANWHAIKHGTGSDASPEQPIERVQSDPAIAKKVSDLMHPGLVLVMTDAP